MSKTSLRWAPVAMFSLISQKMAELSAFSFFSIPVTLHILQKLKCMFWHVLKVAQKKNKWHHWISEVQLHLRDTFLLLLVTFKIWPFLTWPWPDLYFSLLKMPSDSQADTIIELFTSADFDLTCDVNGDLDDDVNKIRFCSTVLAGLSNDGWILKIGPVVSKIGGGL